MRQATRRETHTLKQQFSEKADVLFCPLMIEWVHVKLQIPGKAGFLGGLKRFSKNPTLPHYVSLIHESKKFSSEAWFVC